MHKRGNDNDIIHLNLMSWLVRECVGTFIIPHPEGLCFDYTIGINNSLVVLAAKFFWWVHLTGK